MAPNLLVKAAFVRGDCDNIKKESDVKSSVRTDFILRNIFSHLLKDVYNFRPVRALNEQEEFVLSDLKELVNAFKSSYISAVQTLCSELQVTNDTVGTVLLGVSNELFCEGITWSRIVALFVFVGELTMHCLIRKFPESIVDIIFECFSMLFQENLKTWVDDHGGWEGLQSLSKPHQGNSNQQSDNKGWVKSIFHGTVRMIGTLAHIANTTGQHFP